MTDFTEQLGNAITCFMEEPADIHTDEDRTLFESASILHRLLTEGPTNEMLVSSGTMDNYDCDFGRDNRCADKDHIKWFNAMIRKAVEE